jgi:hypothetical protein
MGHNRQEPEGDSDLAFTLAVLDALVSARKRPVQLRDVERAVFTVLAEAISAGELQPSAILEFDPSQLFARLQELRQADFLARRENGYDVTPEGRTQAEAWIRKASRTQAERIQKGVKAAA